MAHTGVTTGTTPTTYSPDRTVTRGELAVLLHRLAGSPTGFPAHPFFDVTAVWQQDAVSWMSHNAITTGTTPTTYSPEHVATRGEIATFFHRYKGSPGVAIDPASPQCGGTVSFVEAGDLVGSLSLSMTEYVPGVEFTVTLTVTNVSDHPVALEDRSAGPRYLAVHGFPTAEPFSGGGFGAYLWLGDTVLGPGRSHTMSRSWGYGDPDAVEITYEVALAAGDSFNRLVNTVAVVAGVPPVRIPVVPG